MNLSTVKLAEWDKTQSREMLVLFICVCSSQCIIVAHNTAQNRPDNFPSPLALRTITIAPMMSIWGKGGWTVSRQGPLKVEQVFKVIWQKTASPPHMGGSIVFARLRQYVPHRRSHRTGSERCWVALSISTAAMPEHRSSAILVITVCRLKTVKVRHCTKFRSDSAKRGWVIAI